MLYKTLTKENFKHMVENLMEDNEVMDPNGETRIKTEIRFTAS